MRKDLLAITIMLGAVTLFFLPVLLPGKIYFYRDVIFEAYPLSSIVRECFDTRTLPLWNPYIGFGQPLLASPSAQVVYPTTILRMLLPGPVAFKWHVILHSWWAALGMFLLCRRFKLSRVAAILGGLGFVFAGPFVSYMNFMMQVASAAWLPWAFLALDKALSNWNVRRSLLFGAVLGMQFLAGEAVTCMQTIALCSLYGAVIYGNWRSPLARENGRIVATFAIAGIFAMMLSAVYLLPFLRYFSLGPRSVGLTSFEANDQSFHPLFLFDLMVPKFLLFDPYTSTDFSPWTRALNRNYPPLLFCVYLGATQCGLAILGALWGGERRRRFFAVTVVITILIALGSYTHLFDALRWAVPLFRSMRYPVKFLLLTSFSVSILAAYGLEQLRQQEIEGVAQRASRIGFLIISILLVALLLPALYLSIFPLQAYQTVKAFAAQVGIENVSFAADRFTPVARAQLLRAVVFLVPLLLAAKLSGRSRRAIEASVLVLLLVAALDLGLANSGANPVITDKLASFQPQLVELFPSPKADYRVIYPDESTSGEINIPELLPNEETGDDTSIFYTRCLMFPYDNITHQICTGIDGDKLKLYPKEYADLDDFVYGRNKSNDQLVRLLGRFNMRFIVSQHELRALPGLRFAGEAYNFSVEPTRVYELENYLPQTYIATSYSYLPSGKATIERLSGKEFKDGREVILNDESAPRPAETDFVENHSSIVERTLRSFVVEAELNSPGYLVALHHYMPGWRVRVDGKPASFYRANQIFMAVPLEPGKHRVEFSYLPLEFLFGLAISLLAIGTLLAVVLTTKNIRN